MSLVEKYRWGNNTNIPTSNIEIDSLSTLESIKRRQGWMIATQIATVAAIADQTRQTTDALKLVNDTLLSIEDTIQNGFESLEFSIERLELNLIENLNEIKWYLFNVDQKLDQLVNLVKFSGATKSDEFNKQGFILYKIGSNKEAIIQLEKSLQENSLNIEAYINLGFVYLRLENLKESIKNFELASKLINEDFSYYEEISLERLQSTEVFILDNLANLYSIQNEYDQSIEQMNKILSKNIDKKTEILTKYKLAKFKCLNKEDEDAVEVINELINNQYFEPVALAVANPEFTLVSQRILETLQIKLESVKKSFDNIADSQLNKHNNLDIEDDFKKDLTALISKSNDAINNSSNYSILLTSDFKESYNDYLKYIDLISEIKLKTQYELIKTLQDTVKLESIKQENSNIDTNYKYDDELHLISHRILLGKIKSKVHVGIENKLLSLKNMEKVCEKVSNNLTNNLKKLNSNKDADIIDFIHSKFDISKLSNSLLPNFFDKDEKNTSLSTKLIEEYNGMIDKYNSKEKINYNFSLDDKNTDDAVEFVQNALDVIGEIFNVGIDDAKNMIHDKESFISKVKKLPLDKQKKVYEACSKVK